ELRERRIGAVANGQIVRGALRPLQTYALRTTFGVAMKIVACKGETYLIRAFGPAVVLAVFTIYYIESFGLDWVAPVKQASIINFPAVVIGTISLARSAPWSDAPRRQLER